jgi:hypothetical protein
LSDEEKLDKAQENLERKKELVQSCLENPDCDVDTEKLQQALDRIDEKLEKIENGEMPEKSHRKARGQQGKEQ